MTTKVDSEIVSSICEEPGCNKLARWKIKYELDDEVIIAYTCDLHIDGGCSPMGVNEVWTIV